jgi:ATP phosphoribosyltransferase regulatory subunit
MTTLLPSGLTDTLPPYAALDRTMMNALLDRFALFGYAQISPPLMEYESSMLAGKGAAHAANSFRVMDNESQRMMAVRADITPQIERIALQLLEQQTMPLRLSYAGQVLRMRASHGATKRQLRQAGIELIGSRTQVDALEVMLAATEALACVGVGEVVVSLSYAGLLPHLLEGCAEEVQESIHKAIAHKDTEALPAGTPHRTEIIALINQPLSQVRSDETLAFPPQVRAMLDALHLMQQQVAAHGGNEVSVHVDALDTQGFDYHEGMCFSLLSRSLRREIGRGGQYVLQEEVVGCGVTLYVDNLLEGAGLPAPAFEVKTVPRELYFTEGRAWRDKGVMTVVA